MVDSVPRETLEMVARSFFEEATSYGFSQIDYVSFVNLLLDLSMEPGAQAAQRTVDDDYLDHLEPTDLPAEGEHVRIVPYDADRDRDRLRTWLADRYGRLFLLSCASTPMMEGEALIRSDSTVAGTIMTRDDTPIGTLAYLDVNPVQKKAELRKLIGDPRYRGKGLAKEATRLWIQYGLTTLDLRKIYVNTMHTNLANMRLNEDLGFQVEGILRGEVVVDGMRHDVLRMGLLRRG